MADTDHYAAGVGADLQLRRMVFVARLSSLDRNSRVRRGEGGLLVGYATKPAPLHFLAAAGLGVVKGEKDSTAISLPLEVHASWRKLPWVGLGARAFASINPNGNYGAITLALNVGRMR